MKRLVGLLGSLAAVLMLTLPVSAQGPMGPPQPGERGMGPGMGQFERRMGPGPGMQGGMPGGMHGGMQGGMEGHHGGMARRGPMGRPLISLMLFHRDDLGLTAAQVESLETLRTDFMRDAIRRQADLKIAQLDVAALLRPDPSDPTKALDMAKVEAKIREIEKLRADLRVARLRTLEAGKAQLSPEQRTKLAALLAQHRGRWPHGGPERPAPARS